MRYPSLFKPFKVRDFVIPNRIVMAAMGNNLSGPEGTPSPRTMAYYLERAKGGVGLITTEAVAVSLTGRHRARALCLFDPAHEQGMKRFVEGIQGAGSKVAIQINHAGRLVDPHVSGGRVVAPSAIPVTPNRPEPEEMSLEEIQGTISAFARAAQKAAELGFDAIEIHGAHGYLIHQFFSPRSNQRKDAYGGTLAKRMRFPLEVAEAVREAVGEQFPLIFRLSALEYVAGGSAIEEALTLGKELKNCGVDILHVSAGTNESPQSSLHCIQPGALPEGCLVAFAERFSKDVGPPVIGVGRINNPQFADQILSEGKVDLIAMGRGLLADPQWPDKAAEKVSGPIRHCIGCNRCVESISHQNPIECTVNPRAGREDGLPLIPAMKPKKILIAGGGPAGLEAACFASVLGHSVLLYDKEDRIGGQLWEASVAPTKGIMRSIIEYYQTLLQETNVELHLSEALTIETLQQKEVDVVIMATGSTPIRPTLPGVELAHVVTARDVLLGDVPSGESILVVGGGLVGSETAEFLAAKGKQVQLIEMLDDIVMDVEPRTRVLLLERLDSLGVKITTGCRLKSIKRDNATVELQGQELMMPADLVVLAVGSKANDEMTAEIKKGNWETYVVGDAHTPGNIKEAVHQGFHVILETLNDVNRSQPS